MSQGLSGSLSRRVGTAHRNGRVMVGNAHPTHGVEGFSNEQPRARGLTKGDENPPYSPFFKGGNLLPPFSKGGARGDLKGDFFRINRHE